MLLLQQRGDIWRFIPKPGGTGKQMGVAHRAIPTLVVPISSLNINTDFAYEASHVAFFPRYMTDVRRDDELHVGRRTDNSGTVVPNIYVISGLRSYANFGLRHVEYFCKERV